jgi:hypothetical protein
MDCPGPLFCSGDAIDLAAASRFFEMSFIDPTRIEYAPKGGNYRQTWGEKRSEIRDKRERSYGGWAKLF